MWRTSQRSCSGKIDSEPNGQMRGEGEEQSPVCQRACGCQGGARARPRLPLLQPLTLQGTSSWFMGKERPLRLPGTCPGHPTSLWRGRDCAGLPLSTPTPSLVVPSQARRAQGAAGPSWREEHAVLGASERDAGIHVPESDDVRAQGRQETSSAPEGGLTETSSLSTSCCLPSTASSAAQTGLTAGQTPAAPSPAPPLARRGPADVWTVSGLWGTPPQLGALPVLLTGLLAFPGSPVTWRGAGPLSPLRL